MFALVFLMVFFAFEKVRTQSQLKNSKDTPWQRTVDHPLFNLVLPPIKCPFSSSVLIFEIYSAVETMGHRIYTDSPLTIH